MNINITDPIFHDEAKALAHLEADRWPNGEPSCPRCGSVRVRRMGGKTQAGMFLCNDCRDKFTVRTGTVMARSHVPLHKWLLATHIMAASKKGVSQANGAYARRHLQDCVVPLPSHPRGNGGAVYGFPLGRPR